MASQESERQRQLHTFQRMVGSGATSRALGMAFTFPEWNDFQSDSVPGKRGGRPCETFLLS